MNFPGRWTENADRLVPRGNIIWTDGRGASSGRIGGKTVATVYAFAEGWSLRIPGWLWTVTEDMPASRFWNVPGDKLTEVPVRGFKSRTQAKNAAQAVLVAPTRQEVFGPTGRPSREDRREPLGVRLEDGVQVHVRVRP